ncbi:hypothetical protein Rleg2_1165 [Rhizobium leguminosarum bv. trifolii WSM2304]|uniref:Uncharacterized protein n=1 Tax=Rhizobium leguminosarum bv. trifolii (strain WSM2304) TaxID=395492 RepID=A0ABF7QKD2_RHILW|nr:hypothetical protein [Rhizobium leguminosarum]ACI54459.1 hypothetical protein Rleg2_1165 [Rhizobium leguminosarum bv. trifolii WSM2304]
MGRPRKIRPENEKLPDSLNLTLPHKYKSGQLVEIQKHFDGADPSKAILLALDEFWRKREWPETNLGPGSVETGLFDVVPSYENYDFSAIIRHASHLMLRTMDFGRFYATHRNALLERLESSHQSTLILLFKFSDEMHNSSTKDFLHQSRRIFPRVPRENGTLREYSPVFERITIATYEHITSVPRFALWTEDALYCSTVSQAVSPETERIYPAHALAWKPAARFNEWNYIGADMASYERHRHDKFVNENCTGMTNHSRPNIALHTWPFA